MALELVDLIEDVLLHIFSFLDPADLHSLLCLKEDKFSSLVASCLRRHWDKLLITGSECLPGLNGIDSDEDRLRIHHNWLRKDLQVSPVFGDNLKHIGKLRMDSGHFYLSNKGELRIYDRFPDSGLPDSSFKAFGEVDDPVISTMIVRGQHLFTGNYYGECSYFRTGGRVIGNQKIHDSYKDIITMDFHEGKRILVTANFREIKMFHVTGTAIRAAGEMDWRARCLRVQQEGQQLLVGNVLTPFHNAHGDIIQLHPLSLYDLNTVQKRDLNCSSAGVVDMVWHSNPQAVLTGHWAGDLRVFDLRSDRDELRIPKAGSEDVNVSLQYDGHFGVFCGYRNSSEVCLYDLRKPRAAVRSFGVFKHEELSTYLLDIVVDAKHLFVANFNDVKVCDFQ